MRRHPVQILQIGQERCDLIRLKFERRHLRVANNNAFRKSFRQLFNRVTLMKPAERRCLREGAVIKWADTVAVCASRLGIRASFLDETGTAHAFALAHAARENGRRKERREQGLFHETILPGMGHAPDLLDVPRA